MGKKCVQYNAEIEQKYVRDDATMPRIRKKKQFGSHSSNPKTKRKKANEKKKKKKTLEL